jgi:hypothetical protein
VHLSQAAAEATDGGGLLRDLAGAGGDAVRVLYGAAQLLLAYVAEGDVCVVTHHHASTIGFPWTNVVRRLDELAVLRADDRLGSEA